jgi:[acyl-carrier-protein] S-malonyltransferase
MAALLGLDDEAAAQVCAEAGAEVCNYNAPGQIVIGGAKDAVEQACAMARERGAKRAIVLDVAGAFHTSLMQPAVDAFAAAVSSTTMKQPRIPFVNNMSATAMTDPSEIARELVHQLTHPVRWTQCVRYMAEQGVDGVVEFGPGRVLTGLVKRIAPEMSLRNINSVASLSS